MVERPAAHCPDTVGHTAAMAVVAAMAAAAATPMPAAMLH